MFDRQRWGRLKINIALLVFLILVLPALGRAGDTGPLPATNWNRENLSRIKVSPVKSLSFVVLGDSRDNPEVLGQLLKEIDQDPDIAFTIHLGDMVKDADLEKYRTFFQEVRRNLNQPLLAVIGNHELSGNRGLELYHDIYGPDYYAFQINKNYFIMVNDATIEGPGPEQLRWLENELQKSQAYKTRLVFLHTPLFDPRGGEHHHCLQPKPASRLLALFKKYQVTRLFAAHIHSYFDGVWEGVPYTITAGAGAPLYGTDPKHFFYHYLKVSIRGNKVQTQVRPLKTEGRH